MGKCRRAKFLYQIIENRAADPDPGFKKIRIRNQSLIKDSRSVCRPRFEPINIGNKKLLDCNFIRFLVGSGLGYFWKG